MEMVTTAGIGPYKAPASEGSTAAEDAFWALFDPFADAKQAVLFDASRAGLYSSFGANDPAVASARLFDRVGDTLFMPEPVYVRHPVVVTDTATNRPCYQLGYGGAGTNVLSTSAGAVGLVRPSILDAGGNETNKISLLRAGTGYAAGFKFRIPAYGATVNGTAFPAAGGAYKAGGAIFGNYTGSSAFMNLGVRQDNYVAIARNQDAAGGLNGATALNDGAVHTMLVDFDAVGKTFAIYIDGIQDAAGTTTADIATASGGDQLVFGSTTGGVSGNNLPLPASAFGGFLFSAFYLPARLFNSAANRALALSYLAEK